ncbi:hypothetical protein KJI95_08455 [Shewanella sp. JM162201]|uniref:Uncharacterized protein n=1 Tax=Shewanella jiangmenensis TaxID=2837387 RepID=A0ABS5V3Q9_9GAMM|nr:hypothetical protein [Shewanella jiangmenensis]MBT1444560.1 hypothetical protein [Shewanella jiangmenensis]
MKSDINTGLGDAQYRIAACIDKRPAFMHLDELSGFQGLVDGEIAAIGQACGNGWRKVFNVYAKLLWALATEWRRQQDETEAASDDAALLAPHLGPLLAQVLEYPSWQAYRDARLLRPGSGTALLFSPPPVADTGAHKALTAEGAHKALTAASAQKALAEAPSLYIVMGRGYGKALSSEPQRGIRLSWLNESFAIDIQRRIIVCPYFDYRQLSDSRIDELVALILPQRAVRHLEDQSRPGLEEWCRPGLEEQGRQAP